MERLARLLIQFIRTNFKYTIHPILVEGPGEYSIVRPDAVSMMGLQNNGFAGSPNSGIHHNDMNGSFGKPQVGLVENECSLPDGPGRDVMGDVDDMSVWVDTRNDTFHHADKPVLRPEVGSQSDDGRF